MSRQNANAKVSNFTPLHNPIHAAVEGEPVRCIAYGDVEGNSPSYLTVDAKGQSQWQSMNEVFITDSNFLPISNEAIRNLRQGTTSSSR